MFFTAVSKFLILHPGAGGGLVRNDNDPQRTIKYTELLIMAHQIGLILFSSVCWLNLTDLDSCTPPPR